MKYFGCVRKIDLLWLCCTCVAIACLPSDESRRAVEFDTQGHRGARGLRPENTLSAFEEAVRHGMRTLELDLAVSADEQLIVSHEPWFSATICTLDGTAYSESTPLYSLSAAEIRAVDCGSTSHPDFPGQVLTPSYKPTLIEVIAMADSLAAALGRDLPYYNIEIKSKPAYDGTFSPPVQAFAALVHHTLDSLDLLARTTVQSFDVRALRAMRAIDSTAGLALLSESPLSWHEDLDELGFQPAIYSPHHLTLRAEHVVSMHKQGLEVVPWTVNDPARMRTLIDWGVDGIITDYPDRLAPLAPAY